MPKKCTLTNKNGGYITYSSILYSITISFSPTPIPISPTPMPIFPPPIPVPPSPFPLPQSHSPITIPPSPFSHSHSSIPISPFPFPHPHFPTLIYTPLFSIRISISPFPFSFNLSFKQGWGTCGPQSMRSASVRVYGP